MCLDRITPLSVCRERLENCPVLLTTETPCNVLPTKNFPDPCPFSLSVATTIDHKQNLLLFRMINKLSCFVPSIKFMIFKLHHRTDVSPCSGEMSKVTTQMFDEFLQHVLKK